MAQTKPTVLFAMRPGVHRQHFDRSHLQRLETMARVPFAHPVDLDDPNITAELARAEVLLTSWGAPPLTEARLSRMPNLRLVLHAAGSIRGLTTDALWSRGIRISSAADANAVPVAEFTFAMIVLANKRALFPAGAYSTPSPEELVETMGAGCSNYGRSIGIVGFSRIGRRVVSLLRALDNVEILVADPYANPDAVRAAGAQLITLDELLPRVGVLSLHAPDLPETVGMIGHAQLAALRDGAVVLNTARGALIDTESLTSECQAGRLFAVLDVTEPEPLPHGAPLRTLPNVFLTPHLAGSLGTELHRLTDSALDELHRWHHDRPLEHALNVESLRVSA